MSANSVQSPFLNLTSFIANEMEEREGEERPAFATMSPFVSVYEIEGKLTRGDPAREAFTTLVTELYDEEFDEALFELLAETRRMRDVHEASDSTQDTERFLTQHFSRLIQESETAVESLGRQLASRDVQNLSEEEIETYAGNLNTEHPLGPVFEHFLKKLIKKVGKAVKKLGSAAIKVAGKVGKGLSAPVLVLLAKLKGLIKPLLTRVLEKALGKLPEEVQPAARKLAARLGLGVPSPEDTGEPGTGDTSSGQPADGWQAADGSGTGLGDAGGTDAGPSGDGGSGDVSSAGDDTQEVTCPVQVAPGADVTEMQLEFNGQIANLLLAPDEGAMELETARIRSRGTRSTPVFADLDEAREQFIEGLSRLKEGEDPGPEVEHFLPMVLAAVKAGLKLLGRKRIVKFLSGLIAKLITKFVGPEAAGKLGEAIADSGLKLIGLEMPQMDSRQAAAAAVAATVEETIHRISSLPEHVLDNQELLEGYTLEAFEQAAAANLPEVLSAKVYQQRPDLLEGGLNVAWLPLPMPGPRRYKKCTRVFKVKVTPYMAEEIETFDGAPMSEFLQEQWGVAAGTEVEAEVRLYEALPGTMLSDIADQEAATGGIGKNGVGGAEHFHPLTRNSAGTLLANRGLGRPMPVSSNPRTLAAGQRIYHLAVPGRRPPPHSHHGQKARSLTSLQVILDSAGDQIRVLAFLSESRAQQMAVRIRQQAHAGSLAVGFDKLLARRLLPILRGQHHGKIRLMHPLVAPAEAIGPVFRRLPMAVSARLAERLRKWLVNSFAEFVKRQGQALVAASEDPSEGVTLRFTITQPPGLKELCLSLAGKDIPHDSLAGSIGGGGDPLVQVAVFPGHRRG